MRIEVCAPNRIDLAGGTTDIYPLYLLMGGGFTVNLAVDVFSRVKLFSLDQPIFKLRSEDLDESFETTNLENLPCTGPLGLLGLTIKQFPPPKGLSVTTHNSAPPGSGLGASSALTVALIMGLLRIRHEKMDPDRIVQICADIETALIGVPAGKQDHIAACYGGLSIIGFGFQGYERRGFLEGQANMRELEEMIILSYTGAGRFSGMNNWEITKSFIDGDPPTRTKLTEIREIAVEVSKAVETGDWEKLSALINKEWSIRRSLAPGVSNPTIDAMISAAHSAGALASKICGAGGGGCMITLAPPDKRPIIEKALSDQGATIMSYRFDYSGVQISELAEF